MVRVFVSYSHKDHRLVDANSTRNLIPWLQDSLRATFADDSIEFWHDNGIEVGEDYKQRIEDEIDRADVAILLVSQWFINSDFITTVELPRIQERERHGDMIVIPILVEPCAWNAIDYIASRQIVPGKPTPLSDYETDYGAFAHARLEILEEIKRRLRSLSPTPNGPQGPGEFDPKPLPKDRPSWPYKVVPGVIVVIVVIAVAVFLQTGPEDPGHTPDAGQHTTPPVDDQPAAEEEPAGARVAEAANNSVPTDAAEVDNVNIPLFGDITDFTIEATHPRYDFSRDHREPDFTNFPEVTHDYKFTPDVTKLFDDGQTVVEAVREARWWRDRGMEVSVDGGPPASEMHFLRIYRKIADASEWPQYLVLYMDGNLRLIPHPPVGRDSVAFGSSVIVGPADVAERPLAEIESAAYDSETNTLTLSYLQGGSATLDVGDVDRTRARVHVHVDYPTDAAPFATFRSMYVDDGHADVDHVRWRTADGQAHDARIMDFEGGEGIEWFFHRTEVSDHNTSAPDIRITVDTQ